MDKKVKEIARRYLNDGYGSINLLSLIGKQFYIKLFYSFMKNPITYTS